MDIEEDPDIALSVPVSIFVFIQFLMNLIAILASLTSTIILLENDFVTLAEHFAKKKFITFPVWLFIYLFTVLCCVIIISSNRYMKNFVAQFVSIQWKTATSLRADTIFVLNVFRNASTESTFAHVACRKSCNLNCTKICT